MPKKAEPSAAREFPKISAPAMRALVAAGYTTLAQLTRAREADLLERHGMGPKAIRILRDALERQGKHFASPTR